MARAAPASSSEQTAPRASDAHDDAPAPPADDAPAPRESFAGAVDASGCARGRVASRFLGNDLLGGHSRCTAIPLLTLMVFLQFVLTFAVPTLRPYLDARMPAALDDGAWTNVVAYALVCFPTGLAFQAVSAGNVPGAPLSWSAFSVVGLGLFTRPVGGVEASSGRRARPADYVGDLLPEAAKLLRTVQRDLNVSAKVAVPLASLLMLRVAWGVVPSFDRALAKLERGAAGGPRPPPRLSRAAVLARGTSVVGAQFFLMSLGYIILENALVFFIFADGYRARRPAAFAVAYASYVAYGLLVGAALFVSRVLTSVVFCLFHLVSLDVCVLPERYAHLDASHVAFMSLVYAHRRHHDAALHVAAEAFAARKPRHSRARTRWHLAYTLLKNPALRRDRRRPGLAGPRADVRRQSAAGSASSSPSRPSSSSRPVAPRAKLHAAESDGNAPADE
ncbi:hypothetical protein JL722_5408 [Aureococcus anophagefferens]|nr:hypothetical protein JL722_5408 [Aureococcus anophagefferens]